MEPRKIFLIILLLSFLSAGCTSTQEIDSDPPIIKEEPENAMDEDTREEFDQLMEEFKRTGKMPEELSEMSLTLPESLDEQNSSN
jgi:hypothetical protein